MSERRRIGGFFLKARGPRRIYYIRWYDAASRQTPGISTGTADLRTAELALAEHALKASRPLDQVDAPLADVLNRYWFDRGHALASADTFRYAMKAAIECWGDVMVSELTAPKQRGLIADLRARKVSDHTIARWLGCIWAAINHAYEDGQLRTVPARIGNDKWQPHLPARDRVLTLTELAALFNAATRHQHWWRYMVLAVGSASRPAALLELAWPQVALDVGVLHLNAPKRRQTKKRRPSIPMAPTLASWVKDWGPGYLITYANDRLKGRTFFYWLAHAARVHATPYDVRHTVATWLAEQGVTEWECNQFMGHRGPGSATGARYAHYRPEYLRAAADAVERLFEALAPLVTVDLLRGRAIDQPTFEEACVASACQIIEGCWVEMPAKPLNPLVGAAGIEPATTTMSRKCDE